MEHRFDSLAKAVSSAVSRRELFRRLGSGLTLGVLSFFGLAAGDPASCGHCCELQCRTLDVPPRGPEMGVCMQTCLETGVAVGPDGGESILCRETGLCP